MFNTILKTFMKNNLIELKEIIFSIKKTTLKLSIL